MKRVLSSLLCLCDSVTDELSLEHHKAGRSECADEPGDAASSVLIRVKQGTENGWR